MRPHLILLTPAPYTPASHGRRATPLQKRAQQEEKLDTLVPDWLADLELLGRSSNTRNTYRKILKTMLTGVTVPSELTSERVRRIAHERLAAWKPQSVRTGVKVLQSFCGWLVRERHLTTNPVIGVPRPARSVSEHRILSRQETAALWIATKSQEERLLLALLFNGLRAGELCGLEWTDVDAASGILRLRTTKGRGSRTVPLQPRVVELLSSHRALTDAAKIERKRRLEDARNIRRRASRVTPLRSEILAVLVEAKHPLLPREINAVLSKRQIGERRHIGTVLHHMRKRGMVSRGRGGFTPGAGEPTVAGRPIDVDDRRIFQFTPQTLLERVSRLGLRAGIPKVHPHLLRHTFASHFRLEGGDEASLMALGG